MSAMRVINGQSTTTGAWRHRDAGSRPAVERNPEHSGDWNRFDQVWVISLKRRPDRLARFWAEMDKADWPFQRPEVFDAVDGDKVGVPKFWQTGGGSYGCLRSHMSMLERAIMDDVESMLVIETTSILHCSRFSPQSVHAPVSMHFHPDAGRGSRADAGFCRTVAANRRNNLRENA